MALALLDRPEVQDVLQAELSRRHLVDFCERMDPAYARSRHSDLLIEHLEAVERGDIRRLMVFEPPRHSKSYHVSERFPAWMAGRKPRTQGIIASYGAHLAERASRVIRNLVRDERWPFPNVTLADDASAVNRWATNHGGIWVAAGVGGAMTGFGADLLIIDDPVKGRDEADSETYRESVWSWYTEVARTRLMPGGRIVLCQTRWHEDDLAGRILNSGNASAWTVLRLPALAEDNDALGRNPGEALWPAWYDKAALEEIRSELTSEQGQRGWNALYQQRPTADEGGQFKRAWFSERWTDDPQPRLKVLAVDAAFKAGIMNDYSAMVVAGVGQNTFPIIDIHQGRWEYPDLKRQILEMYAEHRPHAILIEDTAAGQSVIQELRLSSHLPILPVKVTASKEARAATVAPVCEAGRVILPKTGRNVGALLDQLAAFPAGMHDDLVDAFVHAISYLTVATAVDKRPKPQGYRVGGRR